MAKKWAEVQANPAYQALAPAEQEAARNQYFDQVIVPQLPADQVDTARSQFDTQTKPAAKAEAPPENAAWTKAKDAWKNLKDTRDALLHTGTGMVGGFAGDVAGLSTIPYGVYANLGQKLGLVDQKTVDAIDPAAVQAKVADALTYTPADPDSDAMKIVQAPGKFIAGAGDKLAEATGADKIPYLDSAVRTIPRAIVELLGLKAGKAVAPAARAAEEVVAETPQATARSTVAPEAPPVAAAPPSTPALPAPGSQAVVPAGAALEGELMAAAPRAGAPKGLPGPEPIPQAPPRAPLEERPAAPKAPPKAPLAKNKNATEAELHADSVKELLGNDIRLTKEQRGIGFVNKAAGSAARAADALIGKGKLAREQMQDFTRAVFKKVGVDAKNATAESMLEMKRNVEAKYEKAHEATVKMDGNFINDLNEIRAEAGTNPYTQGKFETLLDFILRKGEKGSMTAADATEIRSKLGSIESGSDSNITQTARDIKNALDAAGERSATPAQAQAMREARKAYHFMRQIEGAIDPNNGLISPRKLLATINRKRNRNEAFYGAGDQSLVKLAQAGAKVLPEALGDSGTGTRIADWAKFTAPVTMAKAGAAAFGGRLFNEAGARAGTPTALRAAAERTARGSSPLNAAARQAITVPTKEEERRRLQAEALRR